MSDVAIKVENLSKKYILGTGKAGALMETIKNTAKQLSNRERSKPREFYAIHDVSFEIKQGDAVGLIGKNGAGKSTLLKLMSRITHPTAGRIEFKGRCASLLEVGTGFHQDLSGRENIFLNGSMLGMTKTEIKSKFDEIVSFSGTEDFIDTPVKRYSSGMYMRLAFAVAAHLEPEILIVDEVLAVGDVDFQKKCVQKMSEATTKGGATILFVSHNMVAINSLCPTSIMLDHGKLLKQGATPEIIDLYVNYNNTGGSDNYLVKHIDDRLTFDGIRNRDELRNLSITDDVELVLQYTTGNVYMRYVTFEYSLINERGEIVCQAMSKYVTNLVDLPPSSELLIKFRIEKPHLAPGDYFLNMNIYGTEDQLLWIENIPACRVNGNAYFGIVDYFDTVQSATLPPFSWDLKVREIVAEKAKA